MPLQRRQRNQRRNRSENPTQRPILRFAGLGLGHCLQLKIRVTEQGFLLFGVIKLVDVFVLLSSAFGQSGFSDFDAFAGGVFIAEAGPRCLAWSLPCLDAQLKHFVNFRRRVIAPP